MRRLPWAALGLIAASAAMNLVFTGCGSESEVEETDAGGTETGTTDGTTGTDTGATDSGAQDAFIDAILDGARPDSAVCKIEGQSCTKSTECCTVNCDTATSTCKKPITLCKAPGAACVSGNECCTFSCTGGTCSNMLCVADNQPCGKDSDCCGGTCSPDGLGGGKCAPLNPGGPATGGNPCVNNSDCASKFCNNGICTNPSFCVQPDDVCTTNTECCSGNCVKAAGKTLGTCEATAASGAGAGGCAQSGTVCTPSSDGGAACGGNCCSRSCAPYGVAGVNVCQPESGCRLEGNTCRSNSDCCGWSGSPAPLDGPFECVKDSPTQEFGICGKGGSCREPGAICGQALEADGVTVGVCNAANNCCESEGYPPNYCNNTPENCCRRDALGIPRCLLKVNIDCTAPIPAGSACVTSADCCGKPCVNNMCGDTCVPKGGECTNTSDCCPGIICTIPPGATKGYCGGSILPDGGVSPDAGTTDGGTDGGGNLPDGGTCSLYGQQCVDSSECCNKVPCTGGTCRFP